MIPVIYVESDTTNGADGLRLSTKASTGVPYVAISHVWSDGLGNPYQNTLPQCQLLQIQDWVNQLYDKSLWPVPFWIDTICVPLDREHRSFAIQRMSSTYETADKVLVLDGWLLQKGFNNMTEWNMLKIKASSWSQRIWTLQEAMLPRPKSLYFQSPDGAKSENELCYMTQTEAVNRTWRVIMEGLGLGTEEDYLRETHLSTSDMILRLLQRSVQSLETNGYYGVDEDEELPIFKTEGGDERPTLFQEFEAWFTRGFVWSEGRDFMTNLRRRTDQGVADTPIMAANLAIIVGHNMKNRSTSKVEDEALCLASILRQDIKDLLAERSPEGRMKMVFSKLKYISSRSLFTHARRIDETGLRWAPATLLSGGKMYRPGLTFIHPGKVVPNGLLVTLDGLILSSDVSQCANVNDFLVELDSRILHVEMNGEHVYSSAEADSAKCLILEKRLESPDNVNSGAVFVEISRREDDVLVVSFLANYLVRSHNSEDTGVEVVVAAQLVKQQQWCVG